MCSCKLPEFPTGSSWLLAVSRLGCLPYPNWGACGVPTGVLATDSRPGSTQFPSGFHAIFGRVSRNLRQCSTKSSAGSCAIFGSVSRSLSVKHRFTLLLRHPMYRGLVRIDRASKLSCLLLLDVSLLRFGMATASIQSCLLLLDASLLRISLIMASEKSCLHLSDARPLARWSFQPIMKYFQPNVIPDSAPRYNR